MDNFFYEIRSELHKIPEIGLEEYKTSKFITNFLDDLSIEYEKLGTSVLAFFKGEENSWIGFRADIDGLPLIENNEVPYKSTIDGMMHACGHDGHTTNLLYFAKWLKKELDNGFKLKKSVLLIFQAGEEGKAGAKKIAESEFFKARKFEGIFALHLSPDILEGEIGCVEGAMSFQNINLDIEIIGKGCHGAQPHKGVDSILIAAKLIEAYQSIVSRNIDPLKTVILTIGSIKAGEVRNIIPEKVNIMGTIRILDTELIALLKKRLESINEGFERAFEVKINMNFQPFYPPVINSSTLYSVLKKSLYDSDKSLQNIILNGSEDFSFYLQNGNLGLLFLLGIKNEEKGFIYPLHSPNFDFEPSTLKNGFDIFKNLLLEMNK